MADKLEKGQEALDYWDEWKGSIEQARLYFRDKYSDINKLLSEAKITISPPYDVNNPKTLPVISWNEAEDALTEASDEILQISSTFITEVIGIYPGSIQEYIFRMFWISQAFPELMYRFEMPQENLKEARWYTPWYDPQIKLVDGEKVIIDRVCWYRKETDQEQIIQLLPRIWRINDNVLRHRLSGGPKPKDKNNIIYPEGVVCLVLKYKVFMSESEIANLFGWDVYPDKDLYLKEKSSTFRNRIRHGKRVLDVKILKSR